MKRKRIVCVALSLMLVLSLAGFTGCGKKSASNGELNIFTWTEYVPESVIEDFEKEYGIKVNWTTFSSNEDMLMELDKDVITNIENIDSAFLDPSYDPGNKYSVPYQGGVAAIAVNTDKVSKEITSYDDLFSEDLKGSIVSLDDYRAVIGMTARSMGYSMNETDTDKLAKIEEKLLKLKDNVKVYDSDSPKNSLISGDCTVGYCWAAEIALAQEENPAIKIVFPKEGPYVFMDNWAVLKTAKNSENAMKFINYMLDSETSQKVSEEFPYLNPNAKAVEELGDEYKSNEAKNPPADVIASGEYVSNLDTDTLAIYDAMWTKLKK